MAAVRLKKSHVFVPNLAGPGRDVLPGSRIIGQNFQNLAHLDLADAFIFEISVIVPEIQYISAWGIVRLQPDGKIQIV